MSRRKMWTLIALTWFAATILCALPWVWPWYHHLVSTSIMRYYDVEVLGFFIGYLTKSVLSKRGDRMQLKGKK
jgi:hypothetical protein